MAKDDGGPAFPRPYSDSVNGLRAWEQEGISMRDYFAAQALQAVIGQAAWKNVDQAAEAAYEYADAMILARAIS